LRGSESKTTRSSSVRGVLFQGHRNAGNRRYNPVLSIRFFLSAWRLKPVKLQTRIMKENSQYSPIFDIFMCALILSFLLLLCSCSPYKQLNGKPCESLYTLPVCSSFFTVNYHRGKREVYVLTDLRLANNKRHYLQHQETCQKIQVSSIEKKGGLFKLTFQLSEEQFICYEKHLNESDITYCTRNNQKL